MTGASHQPEPHQLLARARAGDEAALSQLFALHRAYLVTLARPQISRRLQGKVDASDIAQEALMQAHHTFKDFRGSTPVEFAAWMRGILAHLISRNVRTYFGTQKRNLGLEQTLAFELDDASSILERSLADLQASPSEAAGQRESHLGLLAAVERLASDYQRVIQLRHFEGASFPEVAAAMNRSVDSVEKLWVRALLKLRTELGRLP